MFGSWSGLTQRQLASWLLLFFLALLIPSGVLIYQSYSQLKWEAFHRHRLQAEELMVRIDRQLNRLIGVEQQRNSAEYGFLLGESGVKTSVLQRSPLSSYPVNTAIPGLLGYFQVDAGGHFSTPLLPIAAADLKRVGFAADEYQRRLSLEQRIRDILSENRLVDAVERPGPVGVEPPKRLRDDSAVSSLSAELSDEGALAAREAERDDRLSNDADLMGARPLAPVAPAQAPAVNAIAQQGFDQLKGSLSGQKSLRKQRSANLGRVEDLKLEKRYQGELAEQRHAPLTEPGPERIEPLQAQDRVKKLKEQAPAPLQQLDALPAEEALPILTFARRSEPFELSLLSSGHFVLYRQVWLNNQRIIQGLLVDQQPFIQGLIEQPFLDTSLAAMSDLLVAYQGDIFSAISGQLGGDYLSSTEQLSGELLYQGRLSSPLSELSLIFSLRQLPTGPGGRVVAWTGAIMLLLLCVAFYSIFRLGARQIALARQQQDFVSAVSHELKTPLTSIRMYGEMLREGWASEEKKRSYYDFIYDESERLSRLINNVLQLARLTRNELKLELASIAVSELMDLLKSKLSSQVMQAGFELDSVVDPRLRGCRVEVDADSISQVMINLVDNAIKFSSNTERRRIELHCQRQGDAEMVISVRDFGPGIARGQMKRIFELFYRSEDELTRETVGTGIGLALVHQLVLAMNGRIDVLNRKPGAEFRVTIRLI